MRDSISLVSGELRLLSHDACIYQRRQQVLVAPAYMSYRLGSTAIARGTTDDGKKPHTALKIDYKTQMYLGLSGYANNAVDKLVDVPQLLATTRRRR